MNPDKLGEDFQTPDLMVLSSNPPSGQMNSGPYCCEAIGITTIPQCWPFLVSCRIEIKVSLRLSI